MGEVWLARDRQLNQEVVTKLVPEDASPETIDLLRHECRQTRSLSHPNIVRVFDFHQCEGVSFITMEHVEGDSIESLRGAAVEDIVQALIPLTAALEYAHQAGVVHRDVKASNVLMDRSGQPRLMDFGIAGVLNPSEGDLLLEGGGSRFSMSPQQMVGEPPQPSDDIYGVGTLAYHLVSGRPPFWPDASEDRILHEIPEPIDPQRSLPPDFQSLLTGMLAKSPADRPSEMASVGKVLRRIEAKSRSTGTRAPDLRQTAFRVTPPPKVEARREPFPDRMGGDPGSKVRRWLTFGTFVLLGVLALGVFLWLPDWVRKRNEAEGRKASASGPVAEVEATQKSPEAPVDAAALEPERSAGLGGAPETSASQGPAPAAEEEIFEPAPPETAQQVAGVVRVEPAVQVEPSSKAEFRRMMSEGLAALANGESAQAKEAFQRALLLSPGSSEATDGLSQAEEDLRIAAISEHRARAAEFEKNEDWESALREYNAVFALDPTIRFAREGKARAEVRSQLAEQLESHIAHPERLSDDEVLERAEQALSDARATEPAGPMLRRQIESLAERIAVATTPIRVELVSDNLTEVTVYRVGRLGRFSQQVLDLRPGTYTVVGSRAGYRDVRRRLTVDPNRTSKPLDVRCEEKI
jgi:tetratricopeptide (TPR) repeat protein